MSLEICNKIGDLLIDKRIENSGLMNGNTGIAVFLYNLAKRTSDKRYQKHADLLMDEIFKKFNLHPNFENGIAGIGWGIESLIQSDFCKGNANEILRGVDARIFIYLNNANGIQLSLKGGLLGYLQYLIMRLKNKKSYKSDQMQINIELFKVIINKIDEIASSQFVNITKDIKFNLIEDIYVLLWSLINAYSLHVHNEKISNMFRQWEPYLVSYIPGLHINRLYLAVLLSQANEFLKSEKISRQINILLYSIDNNQLESEIDIQKISSIQYGYMGFLFVLSKAISVFNSTCPNYEQLIDFKRKITTLYSCKLLEELNNFQNANTLNITTQYGILEGWAGVGLLLLLNPDILE